MNKSKLFMFASMAILAVTIVVSGATYAWYSWSTGAEDETRIVTNLGMATVFYEAGSNIEGVSLKPVSFKEEGIVKGITIKSDRDTTYKLSFNLYLDVIELGEGLKDASFKYSLYKDSTLVKEGNFSSDSLSNNLVTCTTNSTSHIVLLSNETITTTKSVYTLYIWIDGTMSNPSTMQNQTFNFKLHADGQNAVLGHMPTAAEYITNIYNEATKTTVTNNSIEYNYANIYDVDDDSNTSGGLMNDRLGGTTADYDAGNIRYYGASPNNYIYFNCSDYANQSDTTCEKWRIIGVFDGKVKIIRNESIGRFSFDNNTVGTGGTEYRYGKNDWSDARLMRLLNPGYDNYIDKDISGNDLVANNSLWWNGGSGTCYSGGYSRTTSCDFTSTGLKNDTTRNMIEEVTWNLGGWNTNEVYCDQIYGYERGTTVYEGRPTSWIGKVALAYPSDYGYASDFNSCTVQLTNYVNMNCTNTNWMWGILNRSTISFSNFLLTPYTNNYGVWGAEDSSSSLYIYAGTNASNTHGAYPVLYLNSELGIVSGDGTEAKPYVIG